ncbi:glycoside hydrolase family 16 protein [Polyporus arcularius HHB13444]|uniref:Glycoside hydrolase family 16 protein n=1 Tax=Polyporus arcularius HHB13444 TaxID=1314778 RepID=A0A5C3P115_9APHY|nr:glycoside hydrolase family 16 protein [Polyporus arcularius HHB13444]
MRTRYPLLPLAALLMRSASANFFLADSYVGHDFLQSWTWETFDDPTHGRVNYLDQATALASNLTFASDDKFIMRADSQNIVDPNGRGRGSVRIKSNKAYDEAVVVLDLQHMPEGCATWPAFWSLSQAGPWPHGGEIDIIEGVNSNTANLASLHTTPGCTMSSAGPPDRFMSGNVTATDCDASVNFNQGCGVQFGTPASYGSAFNAAGGGFFVMVRSRDASGPGVRIWFWARDDPRVPLEVRAPPPTGLFAPASLYPTAWWGQPDAVFPLSDNCDYAGHFDPHVFVFDLTFCGDWAGTAYSASGCPGDCNDYVNNNPQAFQSAYWEVNSLRIYSPRY